jgi:8-amino-7-oxononanoate synthase
VATSRLLTPSTCSSMLISLTFGALIRCLGPFFHIGPPEMLANSWMAQAGLGTVDSDEMLPSSAGDFFSNDYLSLFTDTVLREHFLRQALAAPRLLGSSDSRLSSFDGQLRSMQRARATTSTSLLRYYLHLHCQPQFLSTVPRKDGVIVHDELRCTGGDRRPTASLIILWPLEECIRNVLRRHAQITQGNSTVLVSLESV